MVGAQDLQCPDGYVVMEISGMDPLIFTKESSSLGVTVTSPRYEEDFFEYNATYYYVDESYTYDEDELLQPLETKFCAPVDKCLMVKVDTESISPEETASRISIMYDTTPYSIVLPVTPDRDSSTTNVFYVEVGDSCKVTCDEDHILLEIEAVTDRSISREFWYGYSTGLDNHFDWQVIDDSTNKVILACPPSAQRPDDIIMDNATDSNSTTYYYNNGCYWGLDGLFRDRVCLPKDGGCYRLVAGKSAENDVKEFQVTLDGEELFRTEHFQFESVLLQHPTESTSNSCNSVRPSCQQSEGDQQASEEMEVFIFRNEVMYEDAQNMIWNIDYIASPGQFLNSTFNSFVAGDRPLQYKRQCVPGCAFFYVSGKQIPIDAQSYSVEMYNRETAFAYRVQADGIIYAEEDHSSPSELPYGLQSSDVIGSSCQQACDAHLGRKHLVQVDYRQDHFNSDYTPDNWSIIVSPQKRAKKDPLDNAQDAYVAKSASGFSRKEPGKPYRKQLCLEDWSWYNYQDGSDTMCVALEMNRNESHIMESFSISVNGEVFDRTIDCSNKVPLAYRRMCSWTYIERMLQSTGSNKWTPLNENCRKKGIPGMISSATVGGVLWVAGVWYCWMKSRRRRQAAASQPSNTPPAPPTTDRHDHAAPFYFDPYRFTPAVVAMNEPVAIPLERKHPSTNPAQQALENHQNRPPTVVGIESAIPDEPISIPPTLIGAGMSDNTEDFA